MSKTALPECLHKALAPCGRNSQYLCLRMGPTVNVSGRAFCKDCACASPTHGTPLQPRPTVPDSLLEQHSHVPLFPPLPCTYTHIHPAHLLSCASPGPLAAKALDLMGVGHQLQRRPITQQRVREVVAVGTRRAGARPVLLRGLAHRCGRDARRRLVRGGGRGGEGLWRRGNHGGTDGLIVDPVRHRAHLHAASTGGQEGQERRCQAGMALFSGPQSATTACI